MVIVLQKGDSLKSIRLLQKKISEQAKEKGVDTSKYCGKIKLKEDALSIQKKMRDEW